MAYLCKKCSTEIFNAADSVEDAPGFFRRVTNGTLKEELCCGVPVVIVHCPSCAEVVGRAVFKNTLTYCALLPHLVVPQSNETSLFSSLKPQTVPQTKNEPEEKPDQVSWLVSALHWGFVFVPVVVSLFAN